MQSCTCVCACHCLYVTTGRLHDVTSTTDDTISLVSHATEERLKNILSKLAVISQHRTDILKVSSEVAFISVHHFLLVQLCKFPCCD